MRRPLLIIAASFTLASCSADYPIHAVFLDGKLQFVGARDDWFFGKTGFCPSYFSVRSQTGETVWRIENTALKSGQLYIMNGRGGDSYHGAFRYRERRQYTVENEPEFANELPDPSYRWDENKL